MSDTYEFTWRERIADWISGGVLIDEIRNLERIVILNDRILTGIRNNRDGTTEALRSILAATEHDKSGTAQKVARMAREALE